jgi:hypothetical protein
MSTVLTGSALGGWHPYRTSDRTIRTPAVTPRIVLFTMALFLQ